MDGNLARHEDALGLFGPSSPRSPDQSTSRGDARSNMISSADPWADDGFSDPDTCRICRGEGTTDEPLFYPCKCSGSIKYVHQNCLMEWLSHSQKKHCELCKTPFRFTKLYSPDMPQRLPFHIFIHHMTRYLFRNILVWLRAALVTSVWLGWLPYLMRSVWSFLFWVSDEGLYVSMDPVGTRNVSWLQGSNTLSVSVTGTTICPSTPLLPVTTTAASIGAVIDQVPVSTLMRAMTAPFNNSGTTNSWFRTLFGLPAQNPAYDVELVGNMNVTLRNLVTKAAGSDSRGSLLSNVGFLHRITRSPAINRIIISVLEGQVITVFVIICFILIILVRDYVVQQQPEINMRAAFAAVEDAENDMAQPAPPANVPVPNPEPVPALGPFHNDEDGDEDGEEDSDSDESEEEYRIVGDHNEYEGLPDVVRESPTHPRRLATMRTRSYNMPSQGDGSSDSSSASGSSQMANSGLRNETESGSLHGASSITSREPVPVQTTIGDYARIYREAEGDIDRIQEIIQNSGLDEALSPVSSLVAENAGSDSSSWTWAGTDDGVDSTAGLSNKGKGRAETSDQDHGASSSLTTMPVSRPRAVSDGPQASLTVNPLANNNWSFQNLPSPQSPEDSTYQDDNSEPGLQPEIPVMSSQTFNTPPLQTSPFITPARMQGVQVTPEGSTDMNELPPADVNPLQPDPTEDEGVTDEPAAPTVEAEARRVVAPPQHPNTIVDRVADFMWGDVPVPVDADGANQEEAVDIFGDNQNPPFMHGGHGARNDDNGPEQEAQMAADVVEAAAAAGLDPEAVEDAEDFDGIMELIGMRGPITGLFQNAIFCAFLVSISIFVGIFVPYNVGRLAAWILANPTRLVHMMFSSAKLAQDGALLAVGYTSTFMFNIFEACRLLLGITQGKQILRTLRLDARQLSNGALDRIIASIRSEIPAPSVSDVTPFSAVRHLSAASHQALLVLKGNLRYCVLTSGHVLMYVFGGDYLAKWTAAREFCRASWPALMSFLNDLPNAGARFGTRATNLNSLEPSIPLDMGLAYWSAYDRTWAILLGYASITLLAALYLARGTTLSTGQTAHEWEASLIDGLNQASGVMKVILIISIEMLVFPLYCGLLLDFALLPLFENTTLASRLAFACNHPFTSIFVHWFIGTGYMFHFALFVSMCRKIMRKGVLYFIRDPDDPEFHPVRDVLERNVTTQLRKILFSAFVYGALVVVCLGAVVWGLSLTIPNVLPIHYTYNEPVLEFPVDLLFCNFLMPLAVKFFKPSDGLHAMYTWWFRRCAGTLRLTWFLFGERRIEEEGKLILQPHVAMEYGIQFSKWNNPILGVNSGVVVVPKKWGDFFGDGQSKPVSKISREDMMSLNDRKTTLVRTGQMIPDGRFVRSPASDQAKIPKGHAVFTDVLEEEIRQHYEEGRPETDLVPNNHYQIVYIPPWFRVRIFTFILSIWVFAAVTGVSSTILPLVFGRRIFKALVPPHIRTNDIYAFSIGVYVLSSASYLVFHLHSAWDTIREWAYSVYNSMLDRHALERASQLARRACKLTYAYAMLLLVFPILITVLVEMYVLIPLHTYMYSVGTADALRLDGHPDGHTVRIIQAWTLGILYLKLGSRALTLYGGRPAHAVRAILRRGWLEPDVGVLTRAFVIPGLIASAIMLFMPPMFAWAVLNWAFDNTTEISYEMQVSAYRLAYPLTAVFWASMLLLRRVLRIFEGWQIRIRDEAYLMGERLHNFSGTAAKASSWRGSSRM